MQVKLSSPLVPYAFRIFDAAAVCLAGWFAVVLKAWVDVPIHVNDWQSYIVLVFIAAFVYVASWGGLYRSWRGSSFLAILQGIFLRWTMVAGLLLLGLFLFKSTDEISRVWFLIWMVSGFIVLSSVRISVHLMLRILRSIGYNHKHIVIVGSGKVAMQLAKRINQWTWTGYEVAHHVTEVDVHWLEELENSNVDEVWLALPLADEELIKSALHALRHSAATIRFVPDLFSLRMINHAAIEIVGMPMYNLSATRLTGLNQVVKWLEDKILSAIILLLISPIMICLAVGVKVTSSGPVFYRQERVGLNNRRFMMLKFRSMPIDTEKNGITWGGATDKTTNSFGQFIRKTSLDELPQFINVLKGDMSIVGPRPERPMFVEQFKNQIPDYMKKHLVKAGITGWAQVNGWRGDTELSERIEHDIFYIENWSLWMDLKIILLTIFKGFFDKNAY